MKVSLKSFLPLVALSAAALSSCSESPHTTAENIWLQDLVKNF